MRSGQFGYVGRHQNRYRQKQRKKRGNLAFVFSSIPHSNLIAYCLLFSQICAIVIANMHVKSCRSTTASFAPNDTSVTGSTNSNSSTTPNTIDPVESILNRANNWCARERIKHYTVNAMERASLYEPFIGLAGRLHPPQTKTSAIARLTQKTSKVEN